MPSAISFYQTLTQVSFTLLGLWFAVLQLGRERRDPTRHRHDRHVALHFFLPGTMGLASVLAGDNGLLWRVAFVVGGLVGLAESVVFLRDRGRPRVGTGSVLGSLGLVLYALVLVAAFSPARVGGLMALQLEGIVTGGLFVVGTTFVWMTFADGLDPVARSGTPPAR